MNIITINTNNEVVGICTTNSPNVSIYTSEGCSVLYKEDINVALGDLYNPGEDTFTKLIKVYIKPSDLKKSLTVKEIKAINSLKDTDVLVSTFLDLINDTRIDTLEVTSDNIKELLEYLQELDVFAQSRVENILQGKLT